MSETQQRGDEIQRLRWQCRRGMLELDVALLRFLEADYRTLDPHRKTAFVRLLQMQDQVLYEWLMGRSTPADTETRELVARMRTFQDRTDVAD